MEVFTCREFGFEWEVEFVSLARQRGYQAQRAAKLLAHDAVVNGMTVQCKRRNYEDPCGGVRVARGQKRYAASDYDVMALNFRGRAFFIPSRVLVMPSGALATKIYLRKLLCYENNWEVFRGPGRSFDPQMSLF